MASVVECTKYVFAGLQCAFAYVAHLQTIETHDTDNVGRQIFTNISMCVVNILS